MNRQQTHYNTLNARQRRNMVLLSDGVTGPANLGGLFRLCDAFGIKEFIIGNGNPDLQSARFRRTARNTLQSVTHRIIADFSEEISELKKKNYFILGLEITNQSTSILSIDLPCEKAVAMIVGGERHGISESVLQLLDATAHIEMYGANSSMNVTQATAIALFELSKS